MDLLLIFWRQFPEHWRKGWLALCSIPVLLVVAAVGLLCLFGAALWPFRRPIVAHSTARPPRRTRYIPTAQDRADVAAVRASLGL